jgi:tagatose 6-phosphate kinase
MILVICANPAIDMYIHFDKFSPGKSNRIDQEFRYPGGKGVHVALSLRELEEKVTLLAFWGGGNGKWIRKKCKEVGIKCIGPKIKEQSRICYTFKTNDGFSETEILGRGPEINSRTCEKFFSEFNDILPKIEIIALSGSLPPGCPPDFYFQLSRMAAEAGKPMFLDCVGEPLRQAINTSWEGMHLNFNEFRDLMPAKDQEDAAKQLSAKARYAAITDGKNGLYLSYDNTMIHAGIHLEKVYSSVGSGDCLLAGLVAARRRGYSLSEMARLGVACAAAKCINNELGTIHINDVIEFLPHVNIKTLEAK